MSLREVLLARIAAQGPISVAEYMADCLMHPTFGYYKTRSPFGADGDFTTAPEISQMFGELIGLCIAQSWMDQGQPTPFALAELGPGRGTLMADILRATHHVPGFLDAAEIYLVEISESLRRLQVEAIDRPATHLNSVSDLPDRALFLIANEFFDALPIRQFVRAQRHWRERQIGASDGALRFGLGPESPQPALSARHSGTRPGDIVEYCPAYAPIADAIGHRIERHGGCGLVIDYGDWTSLGDTLQSVMSHKATDPLASPGQADLTAHVDFEALSEALPCAFTKVTPQGVFLERLGIATRAQALAAQLQGAALDQHIAAHRRLTHPDEMGNLFKVMGLYPRTARPPPGLEI